MSHSQAANRAGAPSCLRRTRSCSWPTCTGGSRPRRGTGCASSACRFPRTRDAAFFAFVRGWLEPCACAGPTGPLSWTHRPHLSRDSARHNHDDVTLSWSGPPRCDVVVVPPAPSRPADGIRTGLAGPQGRARRERRAGAGRRRARAGVQWAGPREGAARESVRDGRGGRSGRQPGWRAWRAGLGSGGCGEGAGQG